MTTRVSRDATVHYRQDWWFPAPRERIWERLERFDQYPRWWSWLREFDADGSGLASGLVLHGRVVPPVPYPFRVAVTIVESSWPELLTARLDGGLTGSARVRLEDRCGDTRVACDWTLQMTDRALRLAARTVPGALAWGHDRVVERTVTAFVARALAAH